ncbi:hypothetical protein RLEG12_08350 (plasmid) [Rhizobium leguminosarum bv. trifolii CB782]|nr:hypothetical protein RLEG12_08350 [Rhizobium leguminosarum bv. trifolii CB782]
MRGSTLEDKLIAASGRPSGFDYMRIVLALIVLCLHSLTTAYGTGLDFAWDTWLYGPWLRLVLPMFFALSGFLVAGSFMRSKSIIHFLGLRFLRIYPALAVEILLSALILGPIVTTVALSQYFGSEMFFRYLLNITGHIYYYLPGVFTDNPYPNKVNGQLWTVPFELLCYISLTAAVVVGSTKKRQFFMLACVVMLIAYPIARFFVHGGELPVTATKVPGNVLVETFLWGVVCYQYRDRLPFGLIPFGVALGISLALFSGLPMGEYFCAPFVAYLTVVLGLLNPRRINLLQGADYSYGVFLYHFAIQQAVVDLLPSLRTWWAVIATSLPASILVAAASWHFVEMPALKLKGRLPFHLPLIRGRRAEVAKEVR